MVCMSVIHTNKEDWSSDSSTHSKCWVVMVGHLSLALEGVESGSLEQAGQETR